jgi:hypothetical protein
LNEECINDIYKMHDWMNQLWYFYYMDATTTYMTMESWKEGEIFNDYWEYADEIFHFVEMEPCLQESMLPMGWQCPECQLNITAAYLETLAYYFDNNKISYNNTAVLEEGLIPEAMWDGDMLRSKAEEFRNFNTVIYKPSANNAIIYVDSTGICQTQMDMLMSHMYNKKVEEVECIQKAKGKGIEWSGKINEWLSADRAPMEQMVQDKCDTIEKLMTTEWACEYDVMRYDWDSLDESCQEYIMDMKPEDDME